MTAIYQLEACPACGSDWRGSPLIPELQPYYGATHTTRIIHLTEGGEVCGYACPDCHERFPVERDEQRNAA